ncbi:BamA/OMP85 family outer membrane protein [Blastopirellula retiformator]|uniref:Outer membrane protein assembly factor BamA n=1 Tax=Blastopirellula retiformator TaxID=2527970 RepID=A0A5C5V3X7_9BACT|nr:POTRA domain-containing protein [Blastopirellula retiformator]TWT33268.1 Outer membrane protein assembly factor BamA precursor [Blastopirellula retiformator]
MLNCRLIAAFALSIGCGLSLLVASCETSLAQGLDPRSFDPALLTPPPAEPGAIPTRPLIVDLRITGNNSTQEAKIRSMIRSRADREFDPEMIQSDVRKLAESGLFRDVKILTQQSAQGVVVTFQVFERPSIRYVKFLGNESATEKALLKKSGLEVGGALNRFVVEDARRRIEEYYRTRGHGMATVTIAEGLEQDDTGVAFMVHEGPLARVLSTSFVGNTIASDGRLKTQVKSKPGFLYYIRGKVDMDQVEADVEALTSYYRGLGYFQAQINRIMEYSESGLWVDITFVVDEGMRYEVRNVSFVGQTKFTEDQLGTQVKLLQGQYFDQKKMNSDLAALTDLYGAQGYIHADVQAEPRFLEEPGQIDLVYDIREGEQYRVGRIDVNIDGEYPHTQRDVVLNRLDLVPGDIIDIRKIRDSERRLVSSQLFVNEPHRGIKPTIQVKPPEVSDIADKRGGEQSPTYRGQSPGPAVQPAYHGQPQMSQPRMPAVQMGQRIAPENLRPSRYSANPAAAPW